MSPQIKAWREAVIRRAAIKIAYRRAWYNQNTPVSEIVLFLTRIEKTEAACQTLWRKIRRATATES
jgi:hypothetical protein